MMNEIIILKNSFKVTEKVSKIFENKDNLIISLDYNSHKQLNNLKIKHVPFENYLDVNDFKIIDNTTFKINTSWHTHQEIKESLTIDGINFGWLLEQELYFFLLTTITNFFSLMKIKEIEKNFQKIIVSSELMKMAKIIFPSCVIEALEENDQKLQNFGFDTYAIKYNIGPFPLSIRIPRKYFFLLQKFYEKSFIPIFQKCFSRIKNDSSSILLIDFNSAREDDFLRCLKEKDTNVFLLNRRRSAIWNLKSFLAVKNTNSIPTTYENFLDNSDRKQIETEIKNMNINLESLFSNYTLFSEIFSISNVSFWPHIENYFKNYCLDRFSEGICELIGSRKLLSKIKPSVILHFFGVALQEKIIIHEAKKINIPSIMLQHGAPHIFLPGWAEFNPMSGTLPVYDEKMAVWGQMMKEYALKNGMSQDNLIVSGSIRHDPYFKKNNPVKDGIILVALLPYFFKRAEDQSISSFQKYEESLKIICNVLKKIKDRKKIVKLHPTDMNFNSMYIEPIIHEIDPSIQIIVEADLTKLIPSSDIVITHGLTTFILDSNIFQKPTVTLMYNQEEFSSKLSHGYSKLFEYTDSEKFEAYVHDLLKDEKIRNENISNGIEFLNSYLSNQGNASEYLSNKICTF
ncbi:MAG: hypothetical protein K5777_03015 [Nitrosopumilus sp.]|nr:hypothetical protein [Nitrosopumilus sp.]